MKVVYGGVRGSYPVADSAMLKFGGETTAVLIEGREGGWILLDAGTGTRLFAPRLAELPVPLLILLTHYHLDHLAGLPQLPALYQRDRVVTIAGPVVDGIGPADALARLLSPPYWPIPLPTVPARVEFRALSGEEGFEWQGLRLRWMPVAHLGRCLAFRLEEQGGGAMVFATDVEWAAAGEDLRRAFLRFCREPRPADLLCFDGAYSPEEYARRRGWGHSTWEEAVMVGRAAGVGRVHIIHHAPEHDDECLARIERAAEALWPHAALARGGQSIELNG